MSAEIRRMCGLLASAFERKGPSSDCRCANCSFCGTCLGSDPAAGHPLPSSAPAVRLQKDRRSTMNSLPSILSERNKSTLTIQQTAWECKACHWNTSIFLAPGERSDGQTSADWEEQCISKGQTVTQPPGTGPGGEFVEDARQGFGGIEGVKGPGSATFFEPGAPAGVYCMLGGVLPCSMALASSRCFWRTGIASCA